MTSATLGLVLADRRGLLRRDIPAKAGCWCSSRSRIREQLIL